MIDAGDMTPTERRFWNLVDVQRHADGTPDLEKCWPWKGCKTRPSVYHDHHPGYGQFTLRRENGRAIRVRSHRFAWECWTGAPMPADKDAAHSCDNPPCCNPTHIQPEDHFENLRNFLSAWGNSHRKSEAKHGNGRSRRSRRGATSSRASAAAGAPIAEDSGARRRA